MKVALIAPPFVEVPPREYGGTERKINNLGGKLIEKGLEVILFASKDSESKIPLREIVDTALFNDPTYNHNNDRFNATLKINEKTLNFLKNEKFDIINVHDYDNENLIFRLSHLNIPILVSIGHAKNNTITNIFEKYKNSPNIHFHGLTQSHAKSISEDLGFIYNGIDFSEYNTLESKLDKSNYFLTLGDMKPIKGHYKSIELAKKIKKDLIIAGQPIYTQAVEYFNHKIKPLIDIDMSSSKEEFIKSIKLKKQAFSDGKIIYFGSADNYNKNILMQNAKFFSFIGNLEVSGAIEAFGITTIEAMACGCPILGADGGVCNELIQEGQNGFVAKSLDDAIKKVNDVSKLDSSQVREYGIKRFDSSIMATNYLNTYRKILGKK